MLSDWRHPVDYGNRSPLFSFAKLYASLLHRYYATDHSGSLVVVSRKFDNKLLETIKFGKRNHGTMGRNPNFVQNPPFGFGDLLQEIASSAGKDFKREGLKLFAFVKTL